MKKCNDHNATTYTDQNSTPRVKPTFSQESSCTTNLSTFSLILEHFILMTPDQNEDSTMNNSAYYTYANSNS